MHGRIEDLLRTSATNKKLRTVLTDVRDKRLVPNPDFQRRLVWSNKHKLAFIQTVLDGLPFPEIFIAAGEVNTETGEGQDLIVDGQQRITTLSQYFTSSPDLKVVGLPEYRDLPSEQKREFLEYDVVIRDLGPLSDIDTRDLFQRINSTSYSLNAMEVNNSRFDGELKRFADEVSTRTFFTENSVFSNYDAKRMNDVRWTLTLVITMMSGYFNRDVEHESFLSNYNDEFDSKNALSRRLENAFAYIDSFNFDSKSRAWQKADLFTLIVEVDKFLEKGESEAYDVTAVAGRLEEFYNQVNAIARSEAGVSNAMASEYFAATRSGSNDRSNRSRRGVVIAAILHDAPTTPM